MNNKIIPFKSSFTNDALEQPVINFSQTEHLAKKYPTPFLILSPTRVTNSINTLREHLPGVKIFYAMKSNPNEALLKIIANLVDGIDVASYGEISICQKIGVSTDNMIHTNPIKRESDIESSVKEGVKWFVIDNMEEIKKIKRLAPCSNLLLRVAITNPHCVVNLSSKFGAHQQDILPLLRKARSEGLKIRGIAFHVGSQCTEPLIYYDAVKYVRKIFNEASSEGFTFDTIDVGGGFPISYKDVLPSLSHYCTVLRDSLREFFPYEINIIAEPGRCISGGCITLVTKVIGRTIRNGTPWYYVDDGVYGAFSGKIFDKCDYRLISNRSGSLKECVVAGPSCDSIDIVAQDQKLPRLAVGDLLLVPGMGAYTSASATSFNGFAPPSTIVVHDEDQIVVEGTNSEIMNKYQEQYAAIQMQ